MAKIKYGGIVSDIRGSVGGVTFRGGAAGATLSSKATVRRSRTPAQERQTALIAESRRAWGALTPGQRTAFAFVYAQRTGFRPAVGQSWSTALGAWTAWYIGIRLCGVVPGAPSSPLETWEYDGNGNPGLFATGFYLTEGFYARGTDATKSPLCVWAIHVGAFGMPPARVVWTLIYCGLTDPVAALVTVPGYGTAYDLTPFLVARGNGRFLGGNVVFKAYRAASAVSVLFNDMVEVVTG